MNILLIADWILLITIILIVVVLTVVICILVKKFHLCRDEEEDMTE